jgi:hypothetical protein
VTGRGKALDSAAVEDMREYLAVLVDQGLNSEERLLALGRYSFATANYPLYVYMTGMLGGREVVPNLASRAAKIAGRAVRKANGSLSRHGGWSRDSGIDAALRFRHESLLQTLEEHARSGKPAATRRSSRA